MAEYTYEPFGATSVNGSPGGSTFTFTARENDGTGLAYYRARYYDSRLQRFLGEDPLGFGGGDPNLHAYTFNSPTNFVDPTGEIVAIPLALCAAGAGGSALVDWWSGRKFDPIKAAGWCAVGLGAGLLGPGIGGAGAGAELEQALEAGQPRRSLLLPLKG